MRIKWPRNGLARPRFPNLFDATDELPHVGQLENGELGAANSRQNLKSGGEVLVAAR